MISDCAKVLDIDLTTCAKSDLAFKSPFTINFTRADCMHALVAYFDCAFTRSVATMLYIYHHPARVLSFAKHVLS